ncbi:MFS transporter [Ornithinimicrobium cerasi]|uniref:MFS transporter n=1 Tax=Ornithinimicrobium cerasi TaxID=2248773 RepID=UPI000F000383|nr:MFS transporter [Ornithinimicrobium cerasi]
MTTSPVLGRTFLHLLVNTAVAGLTTSYLWFGLTFWAYLETRSVLATGIIGGAYMLLVSVSSILFGSVVDHHRKIVVMRFSTVVTLTLFSMACLFYLAIPEESLTDLGEPWFWLLALLILAGSVVEHMRNIALSTTVTILVPDAHRARANGLVGTAQGITFMATSFLSGLSIGLLGMGWTLGLATGVVALGLLHLLTVRMPEEPVPAAQMAADTAAAGGGSAAAPGGSSGIDLRGSLLVIRASTGLLALILFSTFNNFIGGVYMALMDPYGLELFPVEVWGAVLGVTSLGFIIGGAVIAKVGLGRQPVRTLLLCCAAMGVLGALFTVRELWWLYAVGIFLYMCLIPAVEAAEQTVIQRVVPLERQGRVFGFAMAVETAAAPLTAFLIAPLADRWIIPFASSPEGQRALEPLLGTGTGSSRGIALVFLVAGLIMALVALLALASPAYRDLARTYVRAAPPPEDEEGSAGGRGSDAEPGDTAEPSPSAPGQVVTSASGAAATAVLSFLDVEPEDEVDTPADVETGAGTDGQRRGAETPRHG